MSLDVYDDKPADMVHYLKYYGWHFNNKMCNWAVSRMKHSDKQPVTKQQIDELLKNNNIKLEKNELYDYVYVANMCKFDYYGSSIPDDTHLAKFIKDYIDDEDGYPEIAFSRFYIDTVKKGIPIDWEAMI